MSWPEEASSQYACCVSAAGISCPSRPFSKSSVSNDHSFAHCSAPHQHSDAPEAATCEVQGLLAAGHVCTVMGWTEYEPLAAKYRVPIVVTGFEPLDLLEGILMAVRQLEEGRFEVENQYARAVHRTGNTAAQDAIRRVFRVTDRAWRGIGVIAASGLALAGEYAAFDAEIRFD